MPYLGVFRRILERMRPFITVLLLAASVASAQTGPLLLRKPALSKTQIVFTFAGDLWSVPREGGQARRSPRPREWKRRRCSHRWIDHRLHRRV